MTSAPHNSPRQLANMIRARIAREFRDMLRDNQEPNYSDVANSWKCTQ